MKSVVKAINHFRKEEEDVCGAYPSQVSHREHHARIVSATALLLVARGLATFMAKDLGRTPVSRPYSLTLLTAFLWPGLFILTLASSPGLIIRTLPFR